MATQVKLPTLLRKHADGAPVVEGSGATLEEILTDLEARYPGLTARVRDASGGLSRYVNVYVGQEDARLVGGLDAAVAEGQTVSIIPAVAGGSATPGLIPSHRGRDRLPEQREVPDAPDR